MIITQNNVSAFYFFEFFTCGLRIDRLVWCAVYAPYYKDPFHPTLEYLLMCIDRYFEIVDRIRLFSISGGEPLLRTDLPQILQRVQQYEDRIERLEIITNGTMIPSDELIDKLCAFKIKLNLLVDNYGPDKSVNAEAEQRSRINISESKHMVLPLAAAAFLYTVTYQIMSKIAI